MTTAIAPASVVFLLFWSMVNNKCLMLLIVLWETIGIHLRVPGPNFGIVRSELRDNCACHWSNCAENIWMARKITARLFTDWLESSLFVDDFLADSTYLQSPKGAITMPEPPAVSLTTSVIKHFLYQRLFVSNCSSIVCDHRVRNPCVRLSISYQDWYPGGVGHCKARDCGELLRLVWYWVHSGAQRSSFWSWTTFSYRGLNFLRLQCCMFMFSQFTMRMWNCNNYCLHL